MLNINLTSRSSSAVIGLLIFFVPFFTYLSPENLKQLSKSNVLEIFLSLVIILIVIFISSFSVKMLMKRFFKKKIILFPMLCFAFYLNFLYTPFSESAQEFLNLDSNHSEVPIFIFFELCCLAIIAFGSKFNVFSIRMILIFSIFMLINAFIPLFSYLAENIGKNPTISYEIKSNPITQDKTLKKHNVYFIILDAMMPIETAAELNIANKKEALASLSTTGLKYIDRSQSSYDGSTLSIASIILLDYHQTPNSPKYVHIENFYPLMLSKMNAELPLISYIQKANSSFYWSGNNMASCRPSNKWSCINLTNDFSTMSSFKFYLTTPLPKILERILYKPNENQDSIIKFLKYIDNDMPKTPFFAFLHHNSPHRPFLVTNECEPTKVYKYNEQNYEGYKASYHCTLKKLQMFMEKINNIDPEAIVIFQGDHGVTKDDLDLEMTEVENRLIKGKIFNAIKAPEICFKKYGLPKTNVNTIRFALNCAYGFKLPYRENIHYFSTGYGTVVEKIIYK
jgi:hypothetical protein